MGFCPQVLIADPARRTIVKHDLLARTRELVRIARSRLRAVR
jgi:hypothetical protein